MGKVVELVIYQVHTEEGEVILGGADLVAVDEEEGKFRVEKMFRIDLDKDSDERVQEIVKEAEAWISNSRKRYERALEIAEKLGITVRVKEI
ncbi:MAG: hypothetical protein QXF50_01660 [Sulfolobales archaeon]